tara:strand:+ start:594 stop:782 length:189 start_codon:yes stop_codon:yes gene_type:complete
MTILNEIISSDHIKIILEQYKGEEQLRELKTYFFSVQDELREIGVDGSTLAWQIYIKHRKTI